MSKENKKLLRELIDKHTGVSTLTVMDSNTGEYVTTRFKFVNGSEFVYCERLKKNRVSKLQRLMDERAKELTEDFNKRVDPITVRADKRALAVLKTFVREVIS